MGKSRWRLSWRVRQYGLCGRKEIVNSTSTFKSLQSVKKLKVFSVSVSLHSSMILPCQIVILCVFGSVTVQCVCIRVCSVYHLHPCRYVCLCLCVCLTNSKHWFTTSFLGGRCRKAMLGVIVCVSVCVSVVSVRVRVVCVCAACSVTECECVGASVLTENF